MNVIDTESKLKMFLKIFKKKALEQGHNQYSLYPNFCVLLENDKEKFKLPKPVILDMALDIFLED